jgi:hypothetical protein
MRMIASGLFAVVLATGLAAVSATPCEAAAAMGASIASVTTKTSSGVTQVHCRRRWHCHWWGCHRCGW